MEHFHTIFSINVHEKIDFLKKQIINIEENVDVSYIIIINANKYMFSEITSCKEINLKKNVILNPITSEKSRNHGSITHGIYSNLKYIIEKYKFKLFKVLSSRNLFYNRFDKDSILNNCSNKFFRLRLANLKNGWFGWDRFKQTKLSKYIEHNNGFYSHSPHEGLTFNYSQCDKINEFINNNMEIMEEVFNFNLCVEECALQSICINVSHDYYNIGHYSNHLINDISVLPNNKFVYRTARV